MAEVCRNRTDRPDRIGTTGFEVPGGHQPACTSALILDGLENGVNVARTNCSRNCSKRLSFLPFQGRTGSQSVQGFQALESPLDGFR